MTPESSPFSPGQPVPVEFFVGRSAEIERLSGMVRGSAQGRFKIGFVSGEPSAPEAAALDRVHAAMPRALPRQP